MARWGVSTSCHRKGLSCPWRIRRTGLKTKEKGDERARALGKVYKTKFADAVSWFQEHATRLRFEIIRSIGATSESSSIIDGWGASTLVDDLLADGLSMCLFWDLSSRALDVARERLGPKGDGVQWIAGDIR